MTVPRILLVEDSDTQALQLQLMLEAEGFTVDRGRSAEEALDLLNVHRPDLLMVDYRLPGMNGDELARTVRLEPGTRTLPILMLTEEHADELERRGLDSGANAYVPKSNDRAMLLARLRALLRRGRADTSEDAGAFRRATVLIVGLGEAGAALAQTLSRDGYTVKAAGEADAAAAMVLENEIDCVVLGLDPGGDPLAACRRFEALRGPQSNYELLLVGTAADEGPALMEGFAAGADDVLTLGGDRDTLLARFRAAVRRKFARDEEARGAAVRSRHDAALAQARAEAAAADALAGANRELELANRKLTETQGQLVQAAKMASLGELVAGIAHEINNPLAFILAHQATVDRLIGQALDEHGGDARLARARDRLDAMRSGLARIQELITKLRRFSRLDAGERERIGIGPAIDGVLSLLAPKLRDEIAVERRYDGPETLVCSPALVNQVVMNLIANAADAIDGSGRITVRTGTEGGDYLIEVGDSGPGIAPEKRQRVFEPFFTTKPVGAGTGLGLAIAYGVVQAEGGRIRVGESADGGALFTVTVPQEPTT
jgi:two-component system, NtrC family, sensor kinase